MTDQREQERAAGYVYAYEAATNTQALLFGRGGTRRSEIVYRVTLTEDRAPSRQFELQMRGDFTPWLDHELINQIGQAPVAVQPSVSGQPVLLKARQERGARLSFFFSLGSAVPG